MTRMTSHLFRDLAVPDTTYRIDYFLTQENPGEFSIEVVKAHPCGGTERDCVKNINSSPEKISELMDLLAGGIVTPTSLRDIVHDFIAAPVCV